MVGLIYLPRDFYHLNLVPHSLFSSFLLFLLLLRVHHPSTSINRDRPTVTLIDEKNIDEMKRKSDHGRIVVDVVYPICYFCNHS